MTKYGYARVSTKDQNLERQVYALEQEGCEIIFEEKITGTKRDRVKLNELLELLAPGDVIVFNELSRLSRSTKDMLELVDLITSKGADIKSLKETWLDTTSSQGTFMLTVFAGISQLERDMLAERTKDGLENARRKGVKFGRPKQNGDNMQYAIELFKEGTTPIVEICKKTKVSRSTFYRRLEEEGLR